jgi:hypothetical protein
LINQSLFSPFRRIGLGIRGFNIHCVAVIGWTFFIN